jgi:hypothetical protein
MTVLVMRWTGQRIAAILRDDFGVGEAVIRLRRIVTFPLTFRLRKNRGLFLSLMGRSADGEVRLRSSLRFSLDRFSSSRRGIRAVCCGRRSWPTLCFVSGIGGRRQRASIPARMRMRPRSSTLQTIVARERQFSRFFPAHPRSLASVLFPRPAAHRVLLFPDSSPNQMRWVPTPENAPSALGSGAHSRRFAQECPGGNPGKSNKEK